MGLIAKRSTAKLVADVEVPLGAWHAELARTVPELDDAERFGLATHATVLAPLDDSSGSVLWTRADATERGGSHVVCGGRTPSGATDASWSFIVSPTAAASAVLSVPAWKTADDALVDADRFRAFRDRLTAVLAAGPRVQRAPGPPVLHGLLEARVLRKTSMFNLESPFAHDYLLPVPSTLRDGIAQDLPAPAVRSLWGTASEQPRAWVARAGGGDVLGSLDLAGGRDVVVALDLVADGDAGSIRLRWPEIGSASEVSRQRSFRAVVSALHSLAGLAKAVDAAAADRLASWRDDLLAGRDDPHRVERYQPLWSETAPADIVPVPLTQPFPVAVICRTSTEIPWMTLHAAERWALVRLRTWSRGMSKRTADKNRHYLARRPIVVSQDGQYLPIVQYAHTLGSDHVQGFVSSARHDMCFWEVRLRSRPLDDGRFEAKLYVRGLSRAMGGMGYGADLLTLLRAFVWLVQDRHPDVEFETLLLTP